MSERELKIAHTEALFRDVNERIAESAKRFSAADADFVCECADPACADRVHATLDQYEQVRSNGTHFLLVPGHEDPEVERVVKRPAGCAASIRVRTGILSSRSPVETGAAFVDGTSRTAGSVR